MNFITQHWEKIILSVFIIFVCVWGFMLLSQSIELHEEVAMGESLPERAVGEELTALDSADFEADRYVEAPSVDWAEPDMPEDATASRPAAKAWCINRDCEHWLPVDAEVCPYCDTDQEEVWEDPDDDLAPLRRRMFIHRARRQTFGAELRRVTVFDDRPVEEWDLQLSVRGADGRRRTRFRRVGETINVDGEDFEITGLEHKEETRYNPRIRAEETVDVSELELTGPDGETVTLVRGEEAQVGPWRVRLMLTDPQDHRFQKTFTVSTNDTLDFEDVDETRRSFEVEVRDAETVHLRPEEDPERIIEIGRRRPREEQPLPEHQLELPEEFEEEEMLDADW